MARRIPDDRLAQLLGCATQVFIEQGYRRTQMADVAEALGVAKGTLYGYVESKEALFDLVVRCVDDDAWRTAPPAFPVRTPKPGETLLYLRERLARESIAPALVRALTRKRGPAPPGELATIVHELFDQLARNRCGIKLLDRSSRDYPELAALWFAGARGGLLEALAAYIEAGVKQKRFDPVPDVATAARLILETIVFWAVHRHWDSQPSEIGDDLARTTVTHFVTRTLEKE